LFVAFVGAGVLILNYIGAFVREGSTGGLASDEAPPLNFAYVGPVDSAAKPLSTQIPRGKGFNGL